jgi:uncharacterized protein (TIGR03083 family)
MPDTRLHTHPLPHPTYLAGLTAETARFADAIAGADLTARVPNCPEWTLADLVEHVAVLQRWMTQLVADRVTERARLRDRPQRPADPADYPAWLTVGADRARTVLGDTDPLTPMWTWGPDRRARFWARRMLHETLVHRVDAEAAVGAAGAIDPELAADAVDEYLVNLPHAEYFAPALAGLRGTGDVIAFHSTDTGERWVVRLDPDGFGAHPVDAAADAELHAPAAHLALFLYGRARADAPEARVTGDGGLIAHWAANSAF